MNVDEYLTIDLCERLINTNWLKDGHADKYKKGSGNECHMPLRMIDKTFQIARR